MIKSVIFSDNIQIQDINKNISSISTKNYDGPNLISIWINYFIISYINNNINNFNSEIINQYKDNIIYKSNQIINNINNKDNIILLIS